MSGFEIVGLIGAIPGVVTLVTESISLIHRCASSSKLSSVHKGADLQLVAIKDLLIALERRCRDPKKPLWLPDDIQNINQAVGELQDELENLTKLLNSVALACTKGEGRLIRRVRLILSDYENQFREQFQRIEAIKSLLTLTLTNRIHGYIEQAIEDPSERRGKHLLKVKTILQPCNHDFIPPKVHGTLDWVLTHPRIANWMNPSSEKLCSRAVCIYGVKGCGKSVMAASLVADLRLRHSPVGFFSFWAQSEGQRKINHMLATLAWDLISKLPGESFDEIAPAALSLYNPTIGDLFNLTEKAVQLLNQPCFLVIDGLDESTEDWSTDDSGGLKQILDLLDHHPSLRALLLGRETAVRVALKTFSGLEITKDLVHNDIQKLVSEETLKLSNVKPDLRDHIQEFLTNNSTVMFLWVKMVFKELQRCFTASEIKLALEHTPHNLEEEYDRLFSQLLKRMGGGSSVSTGVIRTRRLFQLVLGAMEPLSLDQLRHAYAASCSSGSDWEDHLLSDEGIIDTLGDFIYVSSTRVYLGHASIGEYLTRELPLWPINSDISYFRMAPEDMHSLLALSCINYLRIVDWDSLLRSLVERKTAVLDCYPFLFYSYLRVLFHFFESQDNNLADEMNDFIHSTAFGHYLEYWYHMGSDNQRNEPGSYHFNFLFFLTEVNQLALWYDNIHASPDGFLRVLRRELERRESNCSSDAVGTANFAEILKVWEGLRELNGVYSEELPKNHVVDGISRIGPPLPVAKANSAVTVSHPTPPVAVGAIGRRIFQNHSVTGIMRYAFGVEIFKVNSWLPAPEDLIFEMILRASPGLPVHAVLLVSRNYRFQNKLSQARKLSNIAFSRCKGKGDLVEALCYTNMAYIESDEGQREKSIEYFRKAIKLYESLHSNILFDILSEEYAFESSCSLVRELLQLGNEESSDEALMLLEQTNDPLSLAKKTSKNGRENFSFATSIFADFKAMSRAQNLLRVTDTLYSEGYHSVAVDVSSILLRQLKNNDTKAIMKAKKIMGLSNYELKNYTESAGILEDWIGQSEKRPGYVIGVYCETLNGTGKTDQALELLRAEIPKTTSEKDLNQLHFQAAKCLMVQEKPLEAREEIHMVDFLRNNSGLWFITGCEQACRLFTKLHETVEQLGYETRERNDERLGAWLEKAMRVVQSPESDLCLPSLCAIGDFVYSRGFPEWSLILDAISSQVESDGNSENLFGFGNTVAVAETLFRWAKALYRDGHGEKAEKLWGFCLNSETSEIKSWYTTQIYDLVVKCEERGEFDKASQLFRQLSNAFGALKPHWDTAFCDAWGHYHEGRSLFYRNNMVGARSAYNSAIFVSDDIPHQSFALLAKAFAYRGLSHISSGEYQSDRAREELLKTVQYCKEAISAVENPAESSSLANDGGTSSGSANDTDETNSEPDSSNRNPLDSLIPGYSGNLKVLTSETESCLELMEKEELRVNFNSWQWAKFPASLLR